MPFDGVLAEPRAASHVARQGPSTEPKLPQFEWERHRQEAGACHRG